MDNVELAIRLTADANDASAAMDSVGDAATRMGADVDAATKRADAASERLDGVAESADGVASKGSQAAGALSGLGDLVGGKFGTAMVAGGVAMQGFADAGDLVNVVTESNIVRKTKDIVVTGAHRVATIASTAATKAWAAAQWVLNAAMRANPIGLAVTAALALAGLFILLYKRSDRFRSIVHAVMDASRKAIGKVVDILRLVGKVIATYLMVQWRIYSTLVRAIWKGIQVAIRVVFAAIKLYLTVYKTVALAVWNTVRDVAVRVWGAIRDVIRDRINAIKVAASTIRERFADVWERVRSLGASAMDKLTAPVQGIIDMVDNLIDRIKDIKLPDLNPFNGKGRVAAVPVAGGGSIAAAPTAIININVTAGVGDPIAIAAEVDQAVSRRARYLGVKVARGA